MKKLGILLLALLIFTSCRTTKTNKISAVNKAKIEGFMDGYVKAIQDVVGSEYPDPMTSILIYADSILKIK